MMLTTNGISFHPIPKCDDEVKNLTDEALVEMATRNIRDVKPGMRVDEVIALTAGAMACCPRA